MQRSEPTSGFETSRSRMVALAPAILLVCCGEGPQRRDQAPTVAPSADGLANAPIATEGRFAFGDEAPGERRVLAIMIDFLDRNQACTPAGLDDYLSGPDGVTDYYAEVSNGRTTLTIDVHGVEHLPVTSACGEQDLLGWADAADAQTSAAGVDLESYDTLMYVLPDLRDCSFAGYGGPTRVWASASGCHGPFVHELGHGYGASHAARYSDAYGDNSDVMGRGGRVGFNAPHLEAMRFLPQANTAWVTSSGTYDLLASSEGLGATPSTIRIYKPDTYEFYYLSYRVATGLDTALHAEFVDRVSVHRFAGGNANTQFLSALTDDESFQDLDNDITVTMLSHTSATARVSIGFGAPDTESPTLTLRTSGTSGNIGFEADISDNVAPEWADFYVDGEFRVRDTSGYDFGTFRRYQHIWDSTFVVNGTHTLMVRSGDYAGNLSEASVDFTTNNVDATPPTGEILAPATGSTVYGSVAVVGTATDVNRITKVEFFSGGRRFGLLTAQAGGALVPPYEATFDTTTVADGYTSITMFATDEFYNRSQTALIFVTVENDRPDAVPPTVVLESPHDLDSVMGLVTFSCPASDDVALDRVELFMGTTGTVLDMSVSAPFEFVWDSRSVPDNGYAFYCRAFDTSNNQSNSDVIVLFVRNADDATPPSVSFLSPTTNEHVAGNYLVSVASSDNNAVEWVHLFVDGVLHSSKYADPIEVFTWDTLTANEGLHTLTAQATDFSGNASSTSVVVLVDNFADLDVAPPTIYNVAPADGTEVAVRERVTLSASATDASGVVGMAIRANGAEICATTTDTISCTWRVPRGSASSHHIAFVATDGAANMGSHEISLVVATGSGGGGKGRKK